MSSFFVSSGPMALLMGMPQGEGGGGVSSLMSFLPLVAIVGIFYFLILRPQNKKQKETKRMLEALKKGDRVTTIGGIHGIIHKVREKSVIIKVDENVRLEFSRSAVSTVESQASDDDEDEDGDTPEGK